MPAPFSTPPTFTPGQVVTATDLNAYVRDNPLYLLSRPGDGVIHDNNASRTTTSTSFVVVDGTNVKASVAMSGSVALVGFIGSAKHNAVAGNLICFDVEVDSVRYGTSADGLSTSYVVDTFTNVSFVVRIPGLTAGVTHTFKLMWRVSGGTGTLLAGAGTPSDQFVGFWAQEVA